MRLMASSSSPARPSRRPSPTPPMEGRGLSLLLRHVGRGGAHQPPTPSATARPTSTPSTPSAAQGRGPSKGPGISIKLSALHPRYARAQRRTRDGELYPRLALRLAVLAKRTTSASTSTPRKPTAGALARPAGAPRAEPAGRLERAGLRHPGLPEALPGAGRPPGDLARRSGRRLMVRLVKGAYWDSEIKRAQVEWPGGLPGLHRKPTPTSPSSPAPASCWPHADAIFPQFATHNAHHGRRLSLADPPLARGPVRVPVPARHGRAAVRAGRRPRRGRLGRPRRIYAPVGTHETLLAYLVRLLENGANTSFVNRIADETSRSMRWCKTRGTVVRPSAQEDGLAAPHPAHPRCRAPVRRRRANSRGLDLADETSLRALRRTLRVAGRALQACCAAAGRRCLGPGACRCATPPDRDVVGQVQEAAKPTTQVAPCRRPARRAGLGIDAAAERAACLERAADRRKRERTAAAAAGARSRQDLRQCPWRNARGGRLPALLRRPQARAPSTTAAHPLGPVVCISPWNFPLAIFTGQVAAALATGNPCSPKPAEQTPLVAAAGVTPCTRSRRAARRRCNCCPAGEMVGAPLVGRCRAYRACSSPAPPEVARLLQRTSAPPDGAQAAPC